MASKRKYNPLERRYPIPPHKKRCKKCIYSVGFPLAPGGVACYYMVETKERRGCPAENCDKFTPKPPKKRGPKKKVKQDEPAR